MRLSELAQTKRPRKIINLSASLIAALICSSQLLAIEVTRGPYLQRATPNEITIKWRTDEPSDSVVRYGTSPGSLNFQASVNTSSQNHRVVIQGLEPDTQYYYSVGQSSGAIAGGNSGYRFETSPTAGTSKPTRIWAIGDAGTANENQRAVYNAYLNYPGQENTNLWIMLGDNAYNDGTDQEYQDAVFDMYPDMLRRSTLWSTLGNHDGYSANSDNLSGPYYNIFSFPRNAEAGGLASGTEAYYSFDYANIHFISLDSYDSDRSSNGAMVTWLRNDLAATTQPWVIVFFHHPPYSKGSHDTDDSDEYRSFEMREQVLPILEQYGVDLVLSGHSHSYERSYLIDGHYGVSSTFGAQHQIDDGSGNIEIEGAYKKYLNASNGGTVYSVAGASGKRSGVGNHPAMYMALNELGSVIIDVDGLRLDMKYLNDSGQVRDDFTIIKSEGNAETIQHLGSTSDYDAANNVSIDVPSAANENDLLLLFLSRTDDLLPIQLNGWTAGASCFKTDNGQSECHEIPDCLQQDGNYCLQFEGGNGRDLATVVFYKTFQANDPTSFDFTLRGSKPSWAILSAIRGADNNDPIGDVATESNDGSPDSKFPSVIGNAGDLLLLSMAFDDTTNENDFLAPDGMETYQWIAGSDEAGYVYGQTLLQTGETGVKTTGGPGGPNAKDALISLIVKQGSTNEPPEEGVILKRITNGLDDVEQRADGSMYLDSSDIELVNDNGNQIVGLRFTNLTIPENSTIVSATVQFTTDEASTDSTSLQIRGENTDNSSPFNNTAQNVSSRSTTSATVAWQPDIWSTEGEANSAQRTPELKSIFQEIVNRNGWRAGNNISLIISGEGKRTAEAFEGSTGNAPLLRIEYEPSSDSEDTTPPVITLVGAESITLQQGTSFVDPGATATDNLDGDLSNDIIVTGSVNTGVVGEYILAYDVSDAAGNSASTVTRTITIESNGDGDGDGDDSSGGGLSLALFLLALLRRKRQQKAS